MTTLPEQLPPPAISESEARTLTDELKAGALALQDRALELYEKGAHYALGYSSWGAYWEAEFGGGKAYGYRQVKAGRIRKTLAKAESPIGDWRPNEAQARELARLDDVQAQTNAWRDAVGWAKREDRGVTGQDVKKAVADRRPSGPPKAKKQPASSSPPGPTEAEPTPASSGSPRTPAERVEDFAAACLRLPRLVEALQVETVAQARRDDVEEWLAAFSAGRDAIDMLVERTNSAARENLTDDERAEARETVARGESR